MKPTHTDEILAALATVRMPAQPGEYDIHAAVARALAARGVSAQHEARLGPRCRVDFLCGKIAIEVKKAGPTGPDWPGRSGGTWPLTKWRKSSW